MKKLLLFLAILVSVGTFAAGWQTVKGNGNIKKENRGVTGFSGIYLSGSMNVEVSFGNSNTITIEADENLLPYIETEVEGGRLEIKTKKGYNLKSGSKMMVYVSASKLTSASLSGSGNIIGKGNFAGGSETMIGVSGSGNLQLAFDRLEEANVKVSGSGNVSLKANNANSINAQVSGSGNIDCSNVKAEEVSAQISGSGNIKVYATVSIDAKVAGSGSVYYKGEAPKLNSRISGSGKVRRA